MPFSRPDAQPWITAHFDRLNPQTVLDVGVGAGTYRKLFRRSKARWVGVEIHEPYVKRYRLERFYDKIFVGDFLQLDFDPHDLVILGDVLEHVSMTDAVKMVAKATSIGPTIIVVPVDRYEQGPWEGNDHEAHLWHPTHDMMVDLFRPDDAWSNGHKGAYLMGNT